MKSPSSVRELFKTVLQQMCHFKVDVIAGDANAAAKRSYKSQEYQDLYSSSADFTLREMQREVNTGHPFESGLYIDYLTNHHLPQLHAADDLDCCLMALLSWR